jgi:hypothetical protein
MAQTVRGTLRSIHLCDLVFFFFLGSSRQKMSEPDQEESLGNANMPSWEEGDSLTLS